MPWHLNTDLINATKKGDTKAVKSNLGKGADVNAKDAFGQSALSFAAKYGNMEIAKALIANGADVNAKDLMGGGLALNLAASGGYLNIVEVLLSAGAKIDERGQSGMTALMWAAYNNHPDVAKLLISIDANTDLNWMVSIRIKSKENKNNLTAILIDLDSLSTKAIDFESSTVAYNPNIDISVPEGEYLLRVSDYNGLSLPEFTVLFEATNA